MLESSDCDLIRIHSLQNRSLLLRVLSRRVTQLLSYLGIGNGPLRQIANFAVQKGGAAQLHRDIRNGVVVVRLVHSLQLVEIAEPEGLPIRRDVVGHASICGEKDDQRV